MIFLVFNGTFNGFDPLILLKMRRTYKQRKTSIKAACHWTIIRKVFNETNAGNSLILIDFKDAKMHKGTNNYFQWKKGVKKVLKT